MGKADESRHLWDHRCLDYAAPPANIRIGKNCFLEPSALARFRSRRDPGLVLGDRVRAHTWTPFSIEPEGMVEIGDDSVLVRRLKGN